MFSLRLLELNQYFNLKISKILIKKKQKKKNISFFFALKSTICSWLYKFFIRKFDNTLNPFNKCNFLKIKKKIRFLKI